jgi:D-threonine aldolase
MRLGDLPTPALVVDLDVLGANVATMAGLLPGAQLRPHVKAHKSTELARYQRDHGGHRSFTCATPREVLGMAAAGLGDDLLLANETLDPARLAAMARCAARVTVAVDSIETIDAAAAAGITDVLVDVNVGLPRCGCAPDRAAEIAERARTAGLAVRGVMGYEGHLMMETDAQAAKVAGAMGLLAHASAAVGGDIVSTGGTGTALIHHEQMAAGGAVTEVQAGSYVLMDSHYGSRNLPFRQALHVWTTVISTSDRYAVGDAGLKALGMDHGNPDIPGAQVWFCSDEHITFSGLSGLRPGHRLAVVPAHIDPTLAYHEALHLVRGGLSADAEVIDCWPIDLRGW